MNQPCITDVSLISVERQVQLFQGHLPKMNQPCSSEFPAFTQVQPGEGKLLEMSQPLISHLHTTSQVECADGKQLDMRKICHLFTTMQVQQEPAPACSTHTRAHAHSQTEKACGGTSDLMLFE